MYGGLGNLQRKLLEKTGLKYELTSNLARISLPLHFALAEDPTSLPSRQQGLGVPEVRSLDPCSWRHDSNISVWDCILDTDDGVVVYYLEAHETE